MKHQSPNNRRQRTGAMRFKGSGEMWDRVPSRKRHRSPQKRRSQNPGTVLNQKRTSIKFDKSTWPPGWTEELEREFQAAGPRVYDKAKWHYDGNFPKNLPKKQAYVHTGMFIGWLIEHGMINKEFLNEAKRFKRKEITGAEAYRIWGGALDSEMLTAEGNRFAEEYYDKRFLKDYDKQLAHGLPSSYHVADSWRNYELLRQHIDARYSDWKQTQQKKRRNT